MRTEYERIQSFTTKDGSLVRELMYKDRIAGIRCRASGPATAKSISIKGTGCKSSGCAPKAVELASGDLPFV
jgi:hypothetical protein